MRLATVLVCGGILATGGLALTAGPADISSSKEQMHEDMLELARQIEALAPQAAVRKQAARQQEALLAEYAALSEALGGDDPGHVLSAGGPDGGNGGAAGAPAPPPPPFCTAVIGAFTNATPVAIPTGPAVVTSTITVGGMPTYLWDLNLSTFITHINNADLDITLASPLGTVVTITTDNGGSNDNVYNGTFWGDDANLLGQVPYGSNDGLVTDSVYANLAVETPLVVEEALAAFIGEDPNGDWLLTISDDLAANGGSLDSWTLEITALNEVPLGTRFPFLNAVPVPIPATAPPIVITSVITVAGVPDLICDIDLTTFITHTFAGDLDITLQSPGGTIVTITTDNGGGFDNVYNGTFWDDDANPLGQVPYVNNDGLVTDSLYANLVVETPLVVEEALGAFIGEDPNGDWILTISDDANLDGGSLDSWQLDVSTCACAPPPELCTIFFDKDQFDAFNKQDGKILKGIETFEESNIPDGQKQAFPDPLEGNIPNVDPDTGWGFPEGLAEKNIIIQANILPGPNPPKPAPSGGNPLALYVVGPGFIGSNSKKVGEDLFLKGIHASVDLLFTDPNHTGIGFELSRFDLFPSGGWHITVYNKKDEDILRFDVPPPPANEPGKSFVGVWCEETIGRINIYDQAGPAPDAIDNIQMWLEVPPSCPGEGNCFQPHGGLGCNNADCCALVCAADPFCCEVGWDKICADEAQMLCGNAACPGEGHCLIPHPTPGCNDPICCKKICLIDPFCCEVEWDGVCVGEADDTCASPTCVGDLNGSLTVDVEDLVLVITTWNCTEPPVIDCPGDVNRDHIVNVLDLVLVILNWGPCPGCPGTGNCFQPHPTTGCNDLECCQAVCEGDPFCCEVEWDGLCVEAAQTLCGNAACPGQGDCFVSHPSPGCIDPVCCKKICLADPFCCEKEWDDLCAAAAIETCTPILVKWDFPISALQEVPPNPSPATGQANVVLNNATLELSWNISYSGLLGPISAAHFHGPAAPGVNAGVQVNIGGLPSPIIGGAVITPAQADQLRGGLWYVNLHTGAFPGGEIRGQVVNP